MFLGDEEYVPRKRESFALKEATAMRQDWPGIAPVESNVKQFLRHDFRWFLMNFT